MPEKAHRVPTVQKRDGLGNAPQPLQHHGLSFHRALHYRAQRWRRLARPSDLRTRTFKDALHSQPAFFRSTGQRSYAPKTTSRQLGIIRRVALHGTVGTARRLRNLPIQRHAYIEKHLHARPIAHRHLATTPKGRRGVVCELRQHLNIPGSRLGRRQLRLIAEQVIQRYREQRCDLGHLRHIRQAGPTLPLRHRGLGDAEMRRHLILRETAARRSRARRSAN